MTLVQKAGALLSDSKASPSSFLKNYQFTQLLFRSDISYIFSMRYSDLWRRNVYVRRRKATVSVLTAAASSTGPPPSNPISPHFPSVVGDRFSFFSDDLTSFPNQSADLR
ncbi:hypothetical protein HID58_033523 [Brassica napus]|uniref:Uncharacterized protein n=1 Tax=Brassica napus TaxID=3708 RepID=A0ABQ8BZG7_BRANA|nr:hypothetical protein HID58_033523 [Brassica napus]